MHRRTTRLLAPLAAVGLLAALSACGDSKTDDAKASDSANPSASTSASAQPPRVDAPKVTTPAPKPADSGKKKKPSWGF